MDATLRNGRRKATLAGEEGSVELDPGDAELSLRLLDAFASFSPAYDRLVRAEGPTAAPGERCVTPCDRPELLHPLPLVVRGSMKNTALQTDSGSPDEVGPPSRFPS